MLYVFYGRHRWSEIGKNGAQARVLSMETTGKLPSWINGRSEGRIHLVFAPPIISSYVHTTIHCTDIAFYRSRSSGFGEILKRYSFLDVSEEIQDGKILRAHVFPDQYVDQWATPESTIVLWAGTELNREPEEVHWFRSMSKGWRNWEIYRWIAKKRRFPGFRKVTRNFADIFDLSVYNKRAEETYKQDWTEDLMLFLINSIIYIGF